jgi:hypothetical protein
MISRVEQYDVKVYTPERQRLDPPLSFRPRLHNTAKITLCGIRYGSCRCEPSGRTSLHALQQALGNNGNSGPSSPTSSTCYIKLRL